MGRREDVAKLNEITLWDLRAGLLKASWFVAPLMVVLVDTLKYGLGAVPNWHSTQQIAQHYTNVSSVQTPHYGNTFLINSPSVWLLAGVTHLTSDRGFMGLCLVILVGTIFGIYRLKRVRQNAMVGAAVTVMLLGGAVGSDLFTWLGMYDPVSILGASMGVLGGSKWTRGLGWGLFAFTNPPQAGLGLILYAVVMIARSKWRGVIAAGAGAVSGVIVNFVLMSAYGISFFGRVGFRAGLSSTSLLASLIHLWWLIGFGCVGAGWLIVLSPGFLKRRDTRAFILAVLVGVVIVSMLGADQVRVMGLVVWAGALELLAGGFEEIDEAESTQAIGYAMVGALLVPAITIWSNAAVYPGIEGTKAILSFVLTGHPYL